MKNRFLSRTPHTMKDWLLLAAGVAAVFAAADWLPGRAARAGAFLGLLAPFGWGAAAGLCTEHTHALFAQKALWRQARRGDGRQLCAVFGALALSGGAHRPAARCRAWSTFAGRLGAYEETIRGLLVWVQNTFGIDTATAEQLVQMVGTALQNWFGGLSRSAARAAADFVSGAAGAAGNAVVALAASIYLLSGKGRRCSARPGVSACGAAALPRAVCWKSAVLPTKFSAATSAGSWWTPCSWAGKHLR